MAQVFILHAPKFAGTGPIDSGLLSRGRRYRRRGSKRHRTAHKGREVLAVGGTTDHTSCGDGIGQFVNLHFQADLACAPEWVPLRSAEQQDRYPLLRCYCSAATPSYGRWLTAHPMRPR